MRILPILTSPETMDVLFGPFVDDTDGRTPLTTLTITPALTRISQNANVLIGKNETSNAVHRGEGFYSVKFDFVDIQFAGEMVVAFNITGALPVWERFAVVTRAVFDSYYSGLFGLLDDAISAAKIASNAITDAKIASGAITAAKIATAAITAPKIAPDAITALSIEDNAITNAKIADDAIGSSQLATSAVNEIRDTVKGAILSDATAFAGADIAAIKADVAAVDGKVDAIGTDIATVEGKVDTAISDIAGVDTNVGTAIADIGALDGKVGDPATLGDGATVAAMLTAIAGKTSGAASYDRATDSQEAIRDRGDAAWTTGGSSTLTAQDVRDAMMLAASAGTPAAGSVDKKLDDIDADVTTVVGKLPTGDIADQATVAAIKASTDNLPASPADETTLAAVKAKTDNLPASPANETTSAAIKAKTDNLPATPADEATVLAVKAKTDTLPASPANEVTVAAIKAKTDALPATPADENTVVAVGSAVVAVEGKVDGVASDIAALNDISQGQVETAVQNKLDEAIPEPPVAVPGSTQGVRGILAYLWMVLRNKGTMSKTSGNKVVYNSAGIALFKKVASDDGETYTEQGVSAV